MPLIITEVGVQADGTCFVEIMNTGPGAENGADFYVGAVGGLSANVQLLAEFGATSIAPGEIITIGHSTIPGVQYSDVADDMMFAPQFFAGMVLTDLSLRGIDHVGQLSGPDLGVNLNFIATVSHVASPDFNTPHNPGSYSQSSPFSTSDMGTNALCFAEGTMISTPGGETGVEALQIGDLIRCVDGRDVPVKWIGRQTIVTRFSGGRTQMVRIRAGVLGNHSDLTVTADHGMIVDGLVINASALVNGTSIDWVPMADLPARFTVYHIETEAHDVILANGAPSETYLDMPGRQAFDNYAEYQELYGAERIIPEMRNHRITTQRLLPNAIKARLGIQAEHDCAQWRMRVA